MELNAFYSKKNILHMNKIENNAERYVVSMFWRAPKKNYDKLIECKQATNIFRNIGVLHHEIFQLISYEDIHE